MNAGKIDWQVVRARLAAAEGALERDDEMRETAGGATRREALFAERAAALAAPPVEQPADAFEALVFALGEGRYAVASDQVREVRPLDRLTALPPAPRFVAGLMNVRGRVVPVLDLRPLFGTPVSDSGEPGRAAVFLATGLGDVGIVAADWPTVRWVRESELGPLPAGAPAGLDPTYVRGVTPELIVVLDGERLMASPRLRVEDEGT